MKSVVCPHCGERTVIKEKKIFDDGFSLKEIKFLCGLCGGEVEKSNGSEKKDAGASSAAAERLSALLGGEKVQKMVLAPEEDDGHFCLHCRHYIKHPFLTRCALTLKEVQATDSCGKFELGNE